MGNSGWEPAAKENEVEVDRVTNHTNVEVNTRTYDQRGVGEEANISNRGDYATPLEEEKYSRLPDKDWDVETVLMSFACGEVFRVLWLSDLLKE